mmetsp:Transcript_61052/g.142218  ORF Transcript_61052/g.142218 Transcript_61052/m.142218 type:complete len:92 (-) Transcript_61052:96-371(-)
MARSGAVACLLVCALVLALGNFALSFVGGARGSSLRGADLRAPEVAMQFYGSGPATTTPAPVIEDPSTFIVGLTVFFFLSLAANVQGFFNP